MLSPADMLVVGVAALLFFGPDQLPKVARRAGQVVRDVQATSASFIREMERAADEPEPHSARMPDPYIAEPYAADPYDPEPHAAEHETLPLDPLITTHTTSAPVNPEAPQRPQA